MSKNVIYYGVPGTGKSFTLNNETAKHFKIVTTFHPEYDYQDFIGSYRPVNEDIVEEKSFFYVDSNGDLAEYEYSVQKNKLNYKFVPQVFLKSYIHAWRNLDKPCYLVIEEINRGNCAAIFGNIFQLLDRDIAGCSEYFIDINSEIRDFLFSELSDTDYEIKIRDLYELKNESVLEDPYSVLIIPNNLIILATMNTSDQSLFPMDSAFKRRWDWEYIPINYSDAKLLTKQIILSDTERYSWLSFLQKVNQFIYEVTETEDKCIGPYFVKNNEISLKEFRSKVIFYLWNEVLKNETVQTRLRIFPQKILNGNQIEITIDYNDFYHQEHHLNYIVEMLSKLEVEKITDETDEDTGASASSEADENTGGTVSNEAAGDTTANTTEGESGDTSATVSDEPAGNIGVTIDGEVGDTDADAPEEE